MSTTTILEVIDVEINHFNNAFPDVLNNQNCLYYNVETFNSEFNELNPTDLSIIHLNIRSLAANGDDFNSYLSMLNLHFDVICFSETWINESNLSDNHLFPLYNGYHSSRPPGNVVAECLFMFSKLADRKIYLLYLQMMNQLNVYL